MRVKRTGRCPEPRSIFQQKNVWTFLTTLLLALPAAATERIGLSFATSNDSLSEQLDRWQSTSFQFDVFTGPDWTGRAPRVFGEVLDYRFRTDILTPEDLRDPEPDDRRHVGVMAFGLHSFAARGAVDMRIGGDVFIIGPQTKMLEFQRELHKILGFTIPALEDFQIGNSVRGQVSGEVGRTFEIGQLRVRPFAEAQIGPEDLLRAGVDLTIGSMGGDDLMIRLPATGHRVPGILGRDGRGASLIIGADTAWVEDSVYLPENLGYELTNARTRVRAGVTYEYDRFSMFYGVSWLGEEFEAQSDSQFVGALQLGLRF